MPRKEHRRIAIGVRLRKMPQRDGFAVKVNVHTTVIGHHGQSVRGIRRLLVFGHDHIHHRPIRHQGPGVVVGHDHRAFWAQRQISLSVVEVSMGVNNKVDAVAAQRGNSRFNFVHHLRKLIVYDQYTVLAGRDCNIASQTKEHVEAVCHLLRGDLSALEIPTETG